MAEVSNCFCVYKHTTPNGKCYIGITGQNPLKRWQNGNGYKGQVFYYAIEKYGWDNICHEIISQNLSETEAKKMEIDLIAKYKSNNPEFGYNISSGGNGTHHYKDEYVDENNLKHYVRPVCQYDINFNFISEYPSIAIAGEKTNTNIYALSNACNGRLLTSNNYIWIHKDNDTKEYRDTLKEKILNNKRMQNNQSHNLMPIHRFDTGLNYIDSFNSITEATQILNLSNSQPIYLSCIFKQYEAYGYVWRFQNDVSSPDKYKEENLDEIPNKYKSITQYDLNKNYIKKYQNVTEASKESGIPASRIIEVCKRNRSYCNGFIYRFEFDDEFNLKKKEVT